MRRPRALKAMLAEHRRTDAEVLGRRGLRDWPLKSRRGDWLRWFRAGGLLVVGGFGLIRHRRSPQISKHLLTMRAGLYLNPFQVSAVVIIGGHCAPFGEAPRRLQRDAGASRDYSTIAPAIMSWIRRA
jgi:hypothetical protein